MLQLKNIVDGVQLDEPNILVTWRNPDQIFSKQFALIEKAYTTPTFISLDEVIFVGYKFDLRIDLNSSGAIVRTVTLKNDFENGGKYKRMERYKRHFVLFESIWGVPEEQKDPHGILYNCWKQDEIVMKQAKSGGDEIIKFENRSEEALKYAPPPFVRPVGY